MDPVVFGGHDGGRVLCVQLYERDLVALSCGDKPQFAIVAWSLLTGCELARFVGHRGPVTKVVLLDDERLVSSSDDGTVRIWDATTKRELACCSMRWRVSDFVVAAYSVVAVGESDAACSFELSSGKLKQSGVTAQGKCLASFNENLFVSGDSQGSLWVSGCSRPLRRAHEGGVFALVSDGGKGLFSCGRDGWVHLWRRGDEHEEPLVKTASFGCGACVMCAAAEGGLLVCGTAQGAVLVFCVASGRRLRQFELAGREAVRGVALRDGFVLAGTYGGLVAGWPLFLSLAQRCLLALPAIPVEHQERANRVRGCLQWNVREKN